MSKFNFPRKLHLPVLIVALTLWAAYGIFDVFFEDSNLRVMAANTVYRSGQPFADDWQELYADAPVKSIINLRGPNRDKTWYGPEIAFAAENGIRHYDIALSAHRQPDLATMDKLVTMMREAPKPMLIHCKQGADRSGLASALYAYAIEGESADAASTQLSFWYGHFRWFNTTAAMDNAFGEYVKAHPHSLLSFNNAPQIQ